MKTCSSRFRKDCHPLVRGKSLLLRTFIGFQVLTITKTRSHVVGDDQELQRLCIDAHEGEENNMTTMKEFLT
jgi:hypothetical protein